MSGRRFKQEFANSIRTRSEFHKFKPFKSFRSFDSDDDLNDLNVLNYLNEFVLRGDKAFSDCRN